MKIALVAGETSGDLLGAGLIDGLRRLNPDIECYGIGGPRMQQSGCISWFPMERLSVMGLAEVISRIPELLRLRKKLVRDLLNYRPDVFIGIDAPDFNLSLENMLRREGIRVVHYVSPSVWAWRKYRLRKIRESVDLILTLFPFEEEFYKANNIPVVHVGHPLADSIPMEVDRAAARRELGLKPDAPVLAILPGSRAGEISRLTIPFLGALDWCLKSKANLQCVIPFANPIARQTFEKYAGRFEKLSMVQTDGGAGAAMAAADVLLVASGTATLEGLLYKRPMVVAYKQNPITYAIAKKLVRTPYYSLPNFLAGTQIVREYIQNDVTPQALGEAILSILQNDNAQADVVARFSEIHAQLRMQADNCAAKAIMELCDR